MLTVVLHIRNVIVIVTSTVTNTFGHCGNTYDATRTWKALDSCSNSAFCSQNPRYLPYWQGRGFGEEPVRAVRYKKKHRH